MKMTFYTANCRGNAKNSLYPNRRVIDNEDDCMEVVAFDHVCAEFKGCRRSGDNFLSCDVDVMDCDNSHSDNPADWIHPEDLEGKVGKDVAFVVVPSRNNMKPKEGKSARPRFHVYFPHDPITDGEICAALKKAIQQKFPFFDAKALDSARFIFGHPADSILWHEGEITIDCIVKPQGVSPGGAGREIPRGQRNATMSHFAGRVVKRYGATEKAHEIFMEEAAKCNPPLEDAELAMIWQSACRFAEKVQGQEGYVTPDAYNDEFGRESLKPGDYSDIGQAKVLTREYGVELRYTAATDYLRFCGQYWVESKQQAVGAAEEFLDLQLADAKDEITRTKQALMDTGISEDAITSGGKSLEKKISGGQMDAYLAYLSAQAYKAFVMKRRDMKYVVSALQAAKPMLEISVSDLDKDGFLLNTPDGTYYLPDGLEGKRDHSPEDYIISHREGHSRGIASNHGDPEHLWTQLGMGYTMDGFRKAVKAAMGGVSSGGSGTDGYTKIMSNAVATAEQMGAYIKAKNPKAAQSVLDMVPLYLSEGSAEGVRGDIAFAQSCLETGNFGFSGSAVTLDQNNFCGMGVTSNGVKGNSFGTPQLGIRAQVQHLKAYASRDALKNACIDPRFKYVTRGCAEYVEWLGQKENPDGKGWAAGAGYGEKILSILKGILGMDGGASSGSAGAEVWYRVRKIWADASSQKGAFKSLENARKCADENPGYSVFDETGKAVYTRTAAFKPYLVRISIPDLNIRKGPGTDHGKTGKYTGIGTFTIVEEADGKGASKWGLLKSYQSGRNGWVSLDFAERV